MKCFFKISVNTFEGCSKCVTQSPINIIDWNFGQASMSYDNRWKLPRHNGSSRNFEILQTVQNNEHNRKRFIFQLEVHVYLFLLNRMTKHANRTSVLQPTDKQSPRARYVSNINTRICINSFRLKFGLKYQPRPSGVFKIPLTFYRTVRNQFLIVFSSVLNN